MTGFSGGGRRGTGSSPQDASDAPSPLGWRGYGECVFCRSVDTVWQHDLHTGRSSFRTTFGKGHSWGLGQALCQRCEELYNSGDYGALAQFQTEEPPTHDAERVDHLIGLAAFCRADRGARALPEPSFPDGFEPLAEFTGADWVIDAWPEDRRLSVAETRSPQIDDDPLGRIWLVASPWPSLRLRDVFRVLWRWAERDADTAATSGLLRSRVAEALTWTDAHALAFLRTLEA